MAQYNRDTYVSGLGIAAVNVSGLTLSHFQDTNFTIGHDIFLSEPNSENNEIHRICSIKEHSFKLVFNQDDIIIRIECNGDNSHKVDSMPGLVRQYGRPKHDSALRNLKSSNKYFEKDIIGISYRDGIYVNFCIYVKIGTNYIQIDGTKFGDNLYFEFYKFSEPIFIRTIIEYSI